MVKTALYSLIVDAIYKFVYLFFMASVALMKLSIIIGNVVFFELTSFLFLQTSQIQIFTPKRFS